MKKLAATSQNTGRRSLSKPGEHTSEPGKRLKGARDPDGDEYEDPYGWSAFESELWPGLCSLNPS